MAFFAGGLALLPHRNTAEKRRHAAYDQRQRPERGGDVDRIGRLGAVADIGQSGRPEPAGRVPCRAGDVIPRDQVGLPGSPQHAEADPGGIAGRLFGENGERKQGRDDAHQHLLSPLCFRLPTHCRLLCVADSVIHAGKEVDGKVNGEW
ncbi:MAG: hypothetical protein KF694_15555 [Mesorhizobium sp.]|nr:hypothetical protein [Mesorhizobium sp.]